MGGITRRPGVKPGAARDKENLVPDRMNISDEVTIGAQPSEAELHAMVEDGVRTVISLRHEGEDMQPLSPDEEGEQVRRLGMRYVNIPVAMDDAGPELVDRFRRALEEAPKPVYVHCKLGKRAGAFAMMDQAVRKGWSGEQTIRKADEMGFECENRQLVDFVRDYVNRRRDQEAASDRPA